MSQQTQFRNILYASDRSGTMKWRRIWPIQSIDCIAQQLGIQADYSQTPIIDQNYYRGMTSITIQRWISDQQRELVLKLFKPMMDTNGSWLIYEIDDLMFDGTILDESKRQMIYDKYGKTTTESSIPLFNRGRKAFEGKNVQTNIKQMLLASDFVTTTTNYLKEAYHDIYGVPLENIIAIPNLLPKFLFGDRYDLEKKISQFTKNKAKPRIGIVSSLSHFNIDNVREDKNGKAVREVAVTPTTKKWINEDNQEVDYNDTIHIDDDFDAIVDCIRSTVDEFQYVCFGYCPPQIKDLVDSKKIEFHGGVPIMNYASVFENLKLQAVIAPINKTTFNFSKSFIKYMECASLGVPLFATNCLPYDRMMPSSQLFNDSDDLKEKLRKLKFSSTHIYSDIIERQWKWLNSPCHEGDFNLRNFWLEDNLGIYVDLFRLRPKTLNISFELFMKQHQQRLEQEKNNTMFKNENITITK